MSAALAPVSDRVDRARDRGEPSARAEDASAARRPRYELTTRARADIAFETFDALASRARVEVTRGADEDADVCATRRVDRAREVRCPRVITETRSGPDGAPRYRRYVRERLLGRGGFAAVFAVREMSTGRELACKVIAKSTLTKPRQWKKMKTEIEIHARARNERVVRFERCFEDERHVYILMEMCSSKTLWDIVKARGGMGETHAACYVREALTATAHLHSIRIVHRDLKLGNLFLTQEGLEEIDAAGPGWNDALGKRGGPGRLKIGDFGLACVLEHRGDRRKTICGTPNYIAPEVLRGKDGVGHSYEVDTWSLGVILYTLLYGTPPFQSKDVKLTYKRIRENDYEFPEEPLVSDSTKALIRAALHPEPSKRPSLAQFAAHPFMRLGARDWSLENELVAAPEPALIMDKPSINVKSRKLQERDNVVSNTNDAPLRSPLQTIDQNAPNHHAPSPRAEAKRERFSPEDAHNRDADRALLSTKLQVMSLDAPSSEAREMLGYFPKLWVDSWIKWEYTRDYGMPYQLSDGTVGVYFNDDSSMVFMTDADDSPVVYTPPANERESSTRRDGDGDNSGETKRANVRIIGRTIINPDDARSMYGRAVAKKVLLAIHFRAYFLGKIEDTMNAVVRSCGGLRSVDDARLRSPHAMPPYVKHWTQSSKGISWRLSNKTIQTNFEDGSEMLISTTYRLVVRNDPRLGEQTIHSLDADNATFPQQLVDGLKHVQRVLPALCTE